MAKICKASTSQKLVSICKVLADKIQKDAYNVYILRKEARVTPHKLFKLKLDEVAYGSELDKFALHNGTVRTQRRKLAVNQEHTEGPEEDVQSTKGREERKVLKIIKEKPLKRKSEVGSEQSLKSATRLGNSNQLEDTLEDFVVSGDESD